MTTNSVVIKVKTETCVFIVQFYFYLCFDVADMGFDR